MPNHTFIWMELVWSGPKESLLLLGQSVAHNVQAASVGNGHFFPPAPIIMSNNAVVSKLIMDFVWLSLSVNETRKALGFFWLGH